MTIGSGRTRGGDPGASRPHRVVITLPNPERLRQAGWAAADALVLVLATFAAAWVRYDLDITTVLVGPTAKFAAVATIIYLLIGFMFGPYRVGHVRGSFEETADIGRAAAATMVPLLCMALLTTWFAGIPRSLAVLGPALALVGMFTLRFVVRSYRWGRGDKTPGRRRVIIFGAGLSGQQLVRALQNDSRSSYVPAALLDDDHHKRRYRISGLRVRGGRELIPEVAEATGASALVIAIPSAPGDLVRDLRARAKAAHLDVLLLPPTDQRMGANSSRLRDLDLEDLLGRGQVELDEQAIANTIANKVVLITGAGGSIGSELARQISRFGPAKLVLLDRDESALHAVQMSLTGRALLDDGTLALVSIRDLDGLREVFAREEPELVFHAAALKHLTLLEQFPLEAWKTNVLGTRNVLQAAYEVGVEVFVNVSTDKAANPVCVLGYSKRLAERLTSGFASRDDHSRYVSVRFGNVLGSRGSVLEAFTAQIDRGGPITVTHPDVERYFMLIPEACQLVLQAAAIGTDGDVLVLEMGHPVRILDVAETLVDLSDRHGIDIVFTGLRSGEKITEHLFTRGEQIRHSSHPLVSCVSVPPISPYVLDQTPIIDGSTAASWMRTQAALTADSASGQLDKADAASTLGLVPDVPSLHLVRSPGELREAE